MLIKKRVLRGPWPLPGSRPDGGLANPLGGLAFILVEAVLGREFTLKKKETQQCGTSIDFARGFDPCRVFPGEGNGNPLQCSCLENPRDGGAWWAAVYGVTQSQTRLE